MLYCRRAAFLDYRIKLYRFLGSYPGGFVVFRRFAEFIARRCMKQWGMFILSYINTILTRRSLKEKVFFIIIIFLI